MKKILLIPLIFVSILLITGCNNKEKIKLYTSVEIDKPQYIEQLKNIKIKGTKDYFIITKKTKWKVPKHKKDETVSFVIAIPYKIHVDGKDYKGTYMLNGYDQKTMDKNPKYKFTILNLTSEYETKVLITKKSS